LADWGRLRQYSL